MVGRKDKMLAQAKSGVTRDELAGIVDRHQAGVWRYLRALGCTPALADDLMQEAFVVLMTRDFVHHGDASTGAYLRKTARNLFLAECRHQGRQVNLEDLDAVEAVWKETISDESGETMKGALQQCLRSLTDRPRLALELRYRDKASREQIAERLSIKAGGVKTLLQRARKLVEECVRRRLNLEAGS